MTLIKFRNSNVDMLKINNKYYFKANVFLTILGSFKKLTQTAKALSVVPKYFLWRGDKIGSGSAIYISAHGLLHYIRCKHSYSEIEKKDLLLFLKRYINFDILSFSPTRLEHIFSTELQDFFSQFNKTVKRQVICGDRYIIDFVIDDIAIEYDENRHMSYNKKKEQKRVAIILQYYKKIIRVSSEKSYGYNIGIIAKYFIDNKKGMI